MKRWIMLRRCGPHAIVECETNGRVVATIKELLDSNFSHEVNLTAFEQDAGVVDAVSAAEARVCEAAEKWRDFHNSTTLNLALIEAIDALRKAREQ